MQYIMKENLHESLALHVTAVASMLSLAQVKDSVGEQPHRGSSTTPVALACPICSKALKAWWSDECAVCIRSQAAFIKSDDTQVGIHPGFGLAVQVFRYIEDASSIACHYVWQCHFFGATAQYCHPTLSLQLRDWACRTSQRTDYFSIGSFSVLSE